MIESVPCKEKANFELQVSVEKFRSTSAVPLIRPAATLSPSGGEGKRRKVYSLAPVSGERVRVRGWELQIRKCPEILDFYLRPNHFIFPFAPAALHGRGDAGPNRSGSQLLLSERLWPLILPCPDSRQSEGSNCCSPQLESYGLPGRDYW
jgi:hypothetical protein